MDVIPGYYFTRGPQGQGYYKDRVAAKALTKSEKKMVSNLTWLSEDTWEDPDEIRAKKEEEAARVKAEKEAEVARQAAAEALQGPTPAQKLSAETAGKLPPGIARSLYVPRKPEPFAPPLKEGKHADVGHMVKVVDGRNAGKWGLVTNIHLHAFTVEFEGGDDERGMHFTSLRTTELKPKEERGASSEERGAGGEERGAGSDQRPATSDQRALASGSLASERASLMACGKEAPLERAALASGAVCRALHPPCAPSSACASLRCVRLRRYFNIERKKHERKEEQKAWVHRNGVVMPPNLTDARLTFNGKLEEETALVPAGSAAGGFDKYRKPSETLGAPLPLKKNRQRQYAAPERKPEEEKPQVLV
eukprot:3284874-Prymnesium_polylepis.2